MLSWYDPLAGGSMVVSDMSEMMRTITETAGGEAPEVVVMNARDFFMLRGVFGNSPWRLRIDMRRFGVSWHERRQLIRDWRFAHPALAHLAPKWMR